MHAAQALLFNAIARTGRGVVLLSTLLACTFAHADWYYGWSVRTTGLPGGDSSGTRYYSFESALQAARRYELPSPPYDYGPMWKHLEPAHDPLRLLNPFLATEGYGAGVAHAGTTVASVCASMIAVAPAYYPPGCTVADGGVTPWLPTSYNDYWTCWGNVTCPTFADTIPQGQISPRCPEAGYGYTGFGGQTDFHGRIQPAHACGNINYGQITANFDPGKCNDNCGVGNPISPALGVKTHQETLIPSGSSDNGFEWSWHYSSRMYDTLIKRGGWSHTYSRRLAMAPVHSGSVAATGPVWAYRDDGLVYRFGPEGAVHVPDADIADRLTRLVDGGGNTAGWTYRVAATDDVETYDAYGQLTSIQRRHGALLVMAYSDASTPAGVAPYPGLLVRVTDALGRQLNLTYTAAGEVATVTDPAGNVSTSTYDAQGRLHALRRPGTNALGQPAERTFHYENPNFPNALTGITDEEGVRFATYTYDAQGRAYRTQHANGSSPVAVYTLAFNSDGSSTVTDPLGTVREFGHALVANSIRGTGISLPCDHCGVTNAKVLTYDVNGNVASRTDFNDRKICYAYDLTRNLETTRVEGLLAEEPCATALVAPPARPDVRKVTTTWHATHRLPLVITEPAAGGTGVRTTTHTYVAGNLTQKTVAGPRNDGTSGTTSRTWKWTYGTYGRVLTATDPNNRVTTTTYYPDNDPDVGRRGNVATVTNPKGHVTTIGAYDPNGRPLRITDPNGLVTTITYHPRGWLTSRTVGGEPTSYTYDGIGQLTQVTLPDGATLTYAYDAAHRLTQVADGVGNRIAYTLDAMDNRIREDVYDPAHQLARTRGRAFDPLNRLAAELGAQAQSTSYLYDYKGNRTRTTDPLARATHSAYDALDRLLTVLDPAGGTTTYRYDAGGNLASVTDPRNLTTTYTYDGLGNQVRQASPDTGTTIRTFDAAGNLKTSLDARGVTATTTYDVLNRATRVAYSKTGATSETHNFEYDGGTAGAPNAKGRLTKLTDPAGTTTWTYTPHGRVASATQSFGTLTQTVSYGYNPAGQRTRITTPSGQVIGFSYLNNRVARITVNGIALAQGVVTIPFAAVGAWQWGNGTYTFRDHDLDGRLIRWEHRNGSAIARNDLAWDDANRIIAITDPIQPGVRGTFGYDALDRLERAQIGNPVTTTQQFGYDAVGNRANLTVNSALTNYSYGAASNQLLALSGASSRSYTYDGAGNPTQVNSRVHTYNLANRLVRIVDGATTVATYKVNGLGQRITKTVGSTTTRFVYDDQGRLLGEYDNAGKIIQETVWLEDLPIATLRPTGATGTPTPVDVYYVHADHLGSPRAVTRPSDNAFLWRWDHVDPFGANAANENPAGVGMFRYALRFPGQYYDAETATHYNYFRDYDPTIGRYWQSDPIGLFGGLNTYGYAGANPTSNIDIGGLAYFAKRPLARTPWLGYLSCQNSGVDDRLNTEISHEHLFFEDGKSPANIGHGPYGLFTEATPKGYRCKSDSFNDCVMRKAVANTPPKPYCILGKPGLPKYNCQDWAEEVRREYARLMRLGAEKCGCS